MKSKRLIAVLLVLTMGISQFTVALADKKSDAENKKQVDEKISRYLVIFLWEILMQGKSFPYFMEKTAPVSKMTSLMDYNCEFSGSCSEKGLDFVLKVKVPVQSLCPCSKEISEYGAHNQRSIASISVRFNKTVWIEDLIEIAESSASSSIYSLLKREDEKYITEYAYDNPAFVEDIVRNITEKLMNDSRIIWFEVECENMESIHNHNAWARIERWK